MTKLSMQENAQNPIKTNKGSSIIGFYDHANKAWYEKSTDDIVYGVVVWCEIPKYTEE